MEKTARENRRLNGWKEICRYVGMDRGTIRAHGYPVRKSPGGRSAAVFAYADELLAHALSMRLAR